MVQIISTLRVMLRDNFPADADLDQLMDYFEEAIFVIAALSQRLRHANTAPKAQLE